MSPQPDSQSTRVVYHIDGQELPYMTKLSGGGNGGNGATLRDFKSVLTTLANVNAYKYFFQSHVEGFGVVKEELADDDALLPSANAGGHVVCWLIARGGGDTASTATTSTSSVVSAAQSAHTDTSVETYKQASSNADTDVLLTRRHALPGAGLSMQSISAASDTSSSSIIIDNHSAQPPPPPTKQRASSSSRASSQQQQQKQQQQQQQQQQIYDSLHGGGGGGKSKPTSKPHRQQLATKFVHFILFK